MKVFLTGGSGLLGSHIRHVCVKSQIDVFAPTRQQLNLHDTTGVTESIVDYQPDVVVHCAGLVGGIADNVRRPYEYCFENLQMGLSVVEAARRSGMHRLINISSANIYPEVGDGQPFAEQSVLAGPLSQSTRGYGLAKGCIAKLVEFCNEQYGFSYRNLIPTNLYGEWDDFSPEHAHMIPGIMRRLHLAAVGQERTVEIWGDGSARRAFLYAGDLADFIIGSLDRLHELPVYLNLAPTTDHSVLEYNQIIAEIVGYKGEFNFNLERPVGTSIMRLDTSSAVRAGWSPKTTVEEGLAALYQYFLSEERL